MIIAIVILFILSVVHFSCIIVTAYFYNETTWPYTDRIYYVVAPFKDGCIALLMTRLYYYQGTSEARHDKLVIQEDYHNHPTSSKLLNNETSESLGKEVEDEEDEAGEPRSK